MSSANRSGKTVGRREPRIDRWMWDLPAYFERKFRAWCLREGLNPEVERDFVPRLNAQQRKLREESEA